MSTDEKLRIAIVGAGIAGLSLFQALRFMDKENKLDIKIYESSKLHSDIGAGILFSPRAIQILRAIGLGDQIVTILPDENPPFVVRKGDQPEGLHVHKVKGERAPFLRSELLDILKSNLTNKLHLGHQLLFYEEHDDEIILNFGNGLTACCDFLVGADGIRSAVRKCFLDQQGLSHSPSMNSVWTGTYIYRGLIPAERLQAEFPGHRVFEGPVMYVGKHRSLVSYRVSRSGPVNVAAIKSDPSKEGAIFEGPVAVPCGQDEVLSVFQGWEPEALALLKCLQQPVKWALKILPPLSSYAKGRVALVGDSAHAMTPFQSSGGNTGVEDSYILASLLSSPNCTKTLFPKVTEVYDTMRCGPVNEIAELSRIAGTLFHLRGPGFENVVEGDTSVTVDQMAIIFETIGRMWGPLLKESLEDSRERAITMLQEGFATDSSFNTLLCSIYRFASFLQRVRSNYRTSQYL